MYKKILVATDGSPEALNATNIAVQFMEQKLVEEIVFLHVAQNLTQDVVDLIIQPDTIETWSAAMQNSVKKILGEALTKFEKSDVKTRMKFIKGDPSSTICDYADKNGCDLIIMGSRGNGQLKGLLLGSVSTKVLHYATCPVLIARC